MRLCKVRPPRRSRPRSPFGEAVKAAPFTVAASLAFLASAASVAAPAIGYARPRRALHVRGLLELPAGRPPSSRISPPSSPSRARSSCLSPSTSTTGIASAGPTPFSARLHAAPGRVRLRASETRVRLDTPQMVVNGHTEFVGSDERAARRAIGGRGEGVCRLREGRARGGRRRIPRVLRVCRRASDPADVVFVVAEDPPASEAARGENAGKRLAHVAVARELRIVGATGSAMAVSTAGRRRRR